jgi:osmotically inducible lipoprotein OsmB
VSDQGVSIVKWGRFVIFAAAALALAGCGVSPGCRAVSTGMLGAGSGAAIAAIAGGPVGLGAAIGGATGAIGGAATPPQTAYLGPSPFCY